MRKSKLLNYEMRSLENYMRRWRSFYERLKTKG